MEQQSSLREQIGKQQQRNVYLSQLLKNLEQQLLRAKRGESGSVGVESRAELQLAQMRNVQKRIDIYRHELQKLKGVNTSTVVQELRTLRGQILAKEKLHDEVKKQLGGLQDAVEKLYARNIGHEKNKERQRVFRQRKYEMRNLHRQLQGLQNQEKSQSFKAPRRKMVSSSTLGKQREERVDEDKKGKIDKYAMYKNLIRFYTQEQAKLKKQIEALTSQVEDNKKVKEDIVLYQQKIAALQKK